MVKIREVFDDTHIPVNMIADMVNAELSREALGGQVKPGMRIAITCGSRGMSNNAVMAKAIVDFVKSKGAEPYIVPAMGSHGGATAEGQLQILKDYGITEEAMGCPIKSSMDTVQIGLSGVRHQPCLWIRMLQRRMVLSFLTVLSRILLLGDIMKVVL